MQCSVSSLLVEFLKPWVFLEFLVQRLELLQRVLVVLSRAFDEDVHPEVGLSHFFFVLLLVFVGHSFALSLKLALFKNVTEFKFGGLLT